MLEAVALPDFGAPSLEPVLGNLRTLGGDGVLLDQTGIRIDNQRVPKKRFSAARISAV